MFLVNIPRVLCTVNKTIRNYCHINSNIRINSKFLVIYTTFSQYTVNTALRNNCHINTNSHINSKFLVIIPLLVSNATAFLVTKKVTWSNMSEQCI
jgi:hypothetical protein